MFQLLAQATDQTVTATGAEGADTTALLILLVVFSLLALLIVSYWKIFTKANQAGWASLIPFYNLWVETKIVGRPGWWVLIVMLAAIPFVNLFAAIPAAVLMVIISIDLAKSFGKEPAFGILIILLPIVAYPILAFGKAQYIGPGGRGQH